jgi:hypothetical protein
VIKYKPHLLTVTIDTGNPMPESSKQIFHPRKQHVSQHDAFEMAPQPFDHIQARTIWRQPEYLDLVPMCSEPLPDRLGLVKPPIVTDQTNLSPSISADQGHQKGKKVPPAFILGYCVNDLAAVIIYPTVDHTLFVLARRRNLELLADRPPTSVSRLDEGESPFHLGRPEPPRHRLSPLFFQACKAFFSPFRTPVCLVCPLGYA